jgi:rRNA maturation RNase YbeY
VLSFNIDTPGILGEIYICPEYIINTTDTEKLTEQLIRILIHGILHLKGYDHKKKFKEVDYKDEPMYIKQEEILDKILSRL